MPHSDRTENSGTSSYKVVLWNQSTDHWLSPLRTRFFVSRPAPNDRMLSSWPATFAVARSSDYSRNNRNLIRTRPSENSVKASFPFRFSLLTNSYYRNRTTYVTFITIFLIFQQNKFSSVCFGFVFAASHTQRVYVNKSVFLNYILIHLWMP